MNFKDPKTKEIFIVDNKIFAAINHSMQRTRKTERNEIKKKLSRLLELEDLEEMKGIIKLFVEENKWNK